MSIRNLEIHVAHGCNLSCESCSHYSDQGHSGNLSLAVAEQWMRPWSTRLSPYTFSLLGGEPAIHPDLTGLVLLARRYWPTAHLRLATNGFLLHLHPALPAVLQQDHDACIYLSIHHDSPEYKERLQPVLELLGRWVRDYGIRVEYQESFRRWTRRYHGIGAAMGPYEDGQPRKSWESCQAKYCLQLFEGKLWKCPPLTYLKLQDDKYGLPERWRPYLQYQPLEPGCTDDQLADFLRREDESFCGMCPANPAHFELPMPIRGVEQGHRADGGR